MTYFEKLESIAESFGLNSQLIQLTEECGEVLQAIGKFMRVKGYGQPLRSSMNASEAVMNLAEEMADLQICLYEVIHLLDCDEDVEKFFKAKIDRTYSQINIPYIALDKVEHDGCLGCAFEYASEEEFPCIMCKGTGKDLDLYRKKVSDD